MGPVGLAADWLLGRVQAEIERRLRSLLADAPRAALVAATEQALRAAIRRAPGGPSLDNDDLEHVVAVFGQFWPDANVRDLRGVSLLAQVAASCEDAIARCAAPVEGLGDRFETTSPLQELERTYGLVLDPSGFAASLTVEWQQSIRDAAHDVEALRPIADELRFEITVAEITDCLRQGIGRLEHRLQQIEQTATGPSGLGTRMLLAPPPAGEWGLIGREDELSQLHRTLEERGTAAVVPVTGLGGIGKTALAAAYVQRYRHAYSRIAWVRAERRDLIPQQFRFLVRIWSGRDVGPADAVPEAKALFADNEGWLVVFDNASEREALQPFLPSGPGRVLVTSRNDTWSSNRPTIVPLNALTNDTVVKWLGDALRGRHDSAVLGEIAVRLGGLPLAIVQAIAFINTRPTEDAYTYLDRLRDRDGQRFVLAKHRPADYPDPVATTWDVSVAQLSQDLPVAVDLLGALAYVDPDGVPVEWLGGFINDEDLDEALAQLRRYGLIRSVDNQVTIHRLLQDVTRWNHSCDAAAAYVGRWAARLTFNDLNDLGMMRFVGGRDPVSDWSAGIVFSTPPPNPQDHHHLEWYQIRVPHVLRLLDHAGDDRLASGMARSRRWMPIDLVNFAMATSTSLRFQGSFDSAMTMLMAAQRIVPPGPLWNPIRGEMERKLGDLYKDWGRPQEAIDHYDRALEMLQAHPFGDEHDLATILTSLGDAYRELGDLDTARTLLEHAVEIEVNADEVNPGNLAGSLHNLGLVYRQLGLVEDARHAFEVALDIERRLYEADDPRLVWPLGGLGDALRGCGRYVEARDCLEEALRVAEAAFPPRHPQIGAIAGNLGMTLNLLGEFRQALPLNQRAVDILESVYGPDSRKLALALHVLGNTYHNLDDLTTAIGLYDRALTIYQNAEEVARQGVGDLLCHLGSAHLALENATQAQAVLQQAVALMQQLDGPISPTIAPPLINLGSAYDMSGELDMARMSYRRAVVILDDQFGSGDELLALALRRLTDLHMRRREPRQARTTWKRLVEVVTALHGHRTDEEVASALSTLSLIQEDSGHIGEARGSLQEAVAITEKLFGPDDERSRSIRERLAELNALSG